MTDQAATCYEINAPDVVSDLLDDEVVIINLDTGMYFRATGASAAVWEALIAGADPAPADSDADADADRELAAFVEQLRAHALVRPCSAPGDAPALPPWTPGELALEVHEDLKDLLALDPVHDVDTATGWPRQPEA